MVIEEDHPDHYHIPTELTSEDGFENLPVLIEHEGIYPLIGNEGRGFQGMPCRTQGVSQGTIMGGAQAHSTEYGTCILVGVGTQNSQQRYAVVSSHILVKIHVP